MDSKYKGSSRINSLQSHADKQRINNNCVLWKKWRKGTKRRKVDSEGRKEGRKQRREGRRKFSISLNDMYCILYFSFGRGQSINILFQLWGWQRYFWNSKLRYREKNIVGELKEPRLIRSHKVVAVVGWKQSLTIQRHLMRKENRALY